MTRSNNNTKCRIHQSWNNALWMFLLLLCNTTAEIDHFEDYLVEADAQYVHFMQGYLVAPGYVDLSDLRFFTKTFDADVLLPQLNDDDDDDDFFDDFDNNGDGDGGDDGEGGGRELVRRLTDDASDEPYGLFGGGGITSFYEVEILLFRLPDKCANQRRGCDWTELGVGSKNADGNLQWCCSYEASQLGFCNYQTHKGRLIIDRNLYPGSRSMVNVPAAGPFNASLDTKEGTLGMNNQETSGNYILLLANCDDSGRDVYITGDIVWKSNHGYLPGELWGAMHFFAALLIINVVVFMWYGLAMRKYKESAISIQKYILGTVFLGVMETAFKSADYRIWNADGHRLWAITYVGIIWGVAKRGLSRVLVVMVSMGWGVVNDTLGGALIRVILLGLIYVGVTATLDVLVQFGQNNVEKLNVNEEKELLDVVMILSLVDLAVDMIFLLWILTSLGGTLEYLDSMKQMQKLRLYLRLRQLLLCAFTLAMIWFAVFVFDNLWESFVATQHEWMVGAIPELIYLLILVGVAILWRPNPNAKDYAYVMELATMGDEDNELELTNVVPSAMSMDDDDDDHDVAAEYGMSSNGNKVLPIAQAVDG